MKRALQLPIQGSRVKPWMVACQYRQREAKSETPWVLLVTVILYSRVKATPGLNLRNRASHRAVVFPGVSLDLQGFFFLIVLIEYPISLSQVFLNEK